MRVRRNSVRGVMLDDTRAKDDVRYGTGPRAFRLTSDTGSLLIGSG